MGHVKNLVRLRISPPVACTPQGQWVPYLLAPDSCVVEIIMVVPKPQAGRQDKVAGRLQRRPKS